MLDISVLIGFHREGLFAKPSLSSVIDLIAAAHAEGLSTEVVVTLDNADDLTEQIVSDATVDKVLKVAAGDIAGARNAGISAAEGKFLAILDGDDLWCNDWLTAAYRAASTEPGHIWHPEYLYAFHESDLRFGLPAERPHYETASCFLRHQELDLEFLDIRDLAFENPWSANSFALTEVYRRHPYKPVDRIHRLGIEDFSWNIETVAAGYRHRTVAGTVHMYRVNRPGSQSADNNRQGLLPYLPDNFWAMSRPPLVIAE